MKFLKLNRNSWQRLLIIGIGIASVLWFLIRVIPKPKRASYPCQRAAIPVASGFIIWLIGLFAIKPVIKKIKISLPNRLWMISIMAVIMISGFLIWTMAFFSTNSNAIPKNAITEYNFVPAKSNDPKGIAKGIMPGRVV